MVGYPSDLVDGWLAHMWPLDFESCFSFVKDPKC